MSPSRAPGLADSSGPLCEVFDVALLDLDGVVYVGADAVPSAPEALRAAVARGMRLAFVTNNASRTPAAVADQLRELGVPAAADHVVTSAQAAATLVAAQVPQGSHVLVVGGDGLESALRERGLVPVRSADDAPVAVVQGFSPDVGWRALTEGALALATGIPWIASNLDLTIPTPRGRAPGNGALVGVLRSASGREPVVAGKPELPLHAEAVRRSGARAPLVVGDRLDTDIEGAIRADTPSLLVLTGVTEAADLLAAPAAQRPSFLAADLEGLLHAHRAPALEADRWTLGGWGASITDGVLRVEGAGAPVDALRAACAAAWSRPEGSPLPALRAPATAGLGPDT